MSDPFAIAALGLRAGGYRIETISQNTSSAALPGYRRRVPMLAPFSLDRMKESDALMPSQGVSLQAAGMKATGRPLDVAIDASDQYFALTDGTSTWLTRAGNFKLDAQGVLVGDYGLRVVGVQGDLRLPGNDVQIHADGRITHDGETIAALALFGLGADGRVSPDRGSLLRTSDALQQTEQVRVHVGMLEASNTDSTQEMLSLLEISRQFEALARVMQGYDDVLGRTIQKLGES